MVVVVVVEVEGEVVVVTAGAAEVGKCVAVEADGASVDGEAAADLSTVDITPFSGPIVFADDVVMEVVVVTA